MKTKSKKELPITVDVKIAGQNQIIQTNSVLDTLNNLKIDLLKVKTRPRITFSLNNKKYSRLFTIFQFRQLMAKSINKEIVAKYTNMSLGIK